MIISERIFHLMEQRKMSQKEFSERTGISPSTISDWKRKRTNPASDKIMLICDVLDVTPYELLSGIEKKKYTQMDYVIVDKASEDYVFLEDMRSLDSKRRERLAGYLQALKDMGK